MLSSYQSKINLKLNKSKVKNITQISIKMQVNAIGESFANKNHFFPRRAFHHFPPPPPLEIRPLSKQTNFLSHFFTSSDFSFLLCRLPSSPGFQPKQCFFT